MTRVDTKRRGQRQSIQRDFKLGQRSLHDLLQANVFLLLITKLQSERLVIKGKRLHQLC